MNIKLFINNSEDNKVYKNITYINDVWGELRLPTNILTPIIDIEIPDYKSLARILDIVYVDNDTENDIVYIEDGIENEVDTTSEDERIFNINYIYIDEFNRYYFVKNIECLSNQLFRLYLSVDVLMSHKESFMSLKALVSRNEFTYNDLIEDNAISYYYDKAVEYHDDDYMYQDSGFRFNPEIDKKCYVWTKLSTSEVNGRDTQYPLKPNTYQTGDTKNTEIYVLLEENDVTELGKTIASRSDLLTYVKHLVSYPFQPTSRNPRTLAYYIKSGLSAITISVSDTTYNVEKLNMGVYRIPLNNNYLDYEPYTKYEIFLPYHGWVTLNIDVLKRSLGFFNVYYLVNYATAQSQVFITHAYVGSSIIYSGDASLGVNIPLDTTNMYEIEKQKEALRNSTAISLIGSIFSTAMGYATSNPMMMAGGVISGVKTLAEAQSKYNQMYITGKIDISKAEFGLYASQKILFRVTKTKPINNNQKVYIGKPLNQEVELNTLSGYTQVSDIHLEDIDAMQDEKTNIETLLKNGVII